VALREWMVASVIVAAVGQTFFVARYAVRPWWRHYVGRALFVKSASLWLLLVTEIVVAYHPTRVVNIVFAVVLWVVALAIVGQAVALERQIRAGRRIGA
jgi:hypothetical protein